jgi:hypothetical protein
MVFGEEGPMSILMFLIIGMMAGLIVSSWQGFKDPPWEGFSLRKFLRSITIGVLAGGVVYFANFKGFLIVDNLGVFAFAIVAIERVVGEAYKGFFRNRAHDEYSMLLRRIGVSQEIYLVKVVVGIGFLVSAYWLFRLLAWVLDRLIIQNGKGWFAGLVVGTAGGLLVAIGGAMKDSQFEGFKPFKFLRSPLVGAGSGMLMVHFSTSRLLTVLAMVGSERAGVELYKTFLKRQVRGIHEKKPILFPQWISHRWVFAVSFSCSCVFCAGLLFI